MNTKIIREITPLTQNDCFTIFSRVKKEFTFPLHYHEELELNLTGFQYLPVFSREVPENREHLIRTGYVHAVFEEICKKKKNIPDTVDGNLGYHPSFYLCGWKVMIDEAKKRITDLGFDRKSIHLELYG